MRLAVAIAVAGAAGALARYGIANVALRRHSHGFPWGTFVVNVTGAFALGLIVTLAATRWGVSDWLRTGITVGFLGSYTTFSTFSIDTYRLTTERELGIAAANVFGSCAAGLAALYLGIVLARTI